MSGETISTTSLNIQLLIEDKLSPLRPIADGDTPLAELIGKWRGSSVAERCDDIEKNYVLGLLQKVIDQFPDHDSTTLSNTRSIINPEQKPALVKLKNDAQLSDDDMSVVMYLWTGGALGLRKK